MPVRNRRLLTSYTHLAFTAYDWLINLDEEIHCFWDFLRGRRPTVAALLYGLNRYPPHRCAHSSITNDISHVGQGACHCAVLLPEVHLFADDSRSLPGVRFPVLPYNFPLPTHQKVLPAVKSIIASKS